MKKSIIYLQKGISLIDKGEYNEALDYINKSIKENPNLIKPYYYKGITYQILSKYEKAIECFNKILSINPNHIESLISKGTVYCLLGNLNQGIEFYNKALNLNKNNYEALMNKSIALKKLKKYQEVLDCLEKLIIIKKDNDDIFFERSNCFQKLGLYEEAIKSLDKALKINPNNIKYLFQKVKCLNILNKQDEAISSIDKILQNDNKLNHKDNNINNIIVDSHLLKIKILLDKNEIELVEKEFKEIKNSNNIDKSLLKPLFKLGYSLYEKKNFKLAIQCYDLILDIEPSNENAMIKKSDMLLFEKNFQGALELYEKVLKINEYNEESLIGIGVCKYNMNEIDDSIIYFDKVLKINKENKNAINNKAIALFNKGDNQLLKNILKKSDIVNENIYLLFSKGLYLFKAKNYDSATKYFELCLKKDENDTDFLYQAGLNYYENKKYDIAIKTFDKALKLEPDSPKIINSKAIVLQEINKEKESLALFKKAAEFKPENALYLKNYCKSLLRNKDFDKCKEILLKLKNICESGVQKKLDLIDIQNSIVEIENELKSANKAVRKSIIHYEKPLGLINVNLNCYMNSVIQCLFHVFEYRDFFIKESFSKSEQPVSYELSNIFKKLKNRNEGKPFSLQDFKLLMGEFDDSFLGSNGADATDLLRYIISLVSSEYIDDNNNLINEEQTLDEGNEEEVFKEIQKTSNPKIINNIFYIYNKTTYFCKEKHKTFSFDYNSLLEFNLLDLTKTIEKKYNKKINEIHLRDCFILNKKIISEDYEFYCQKCQKDTIGKSISNLYKTKDYLIIILDYGKNKALRIKVIYDEFININEFVENGDQEYYELIGAVFHYGDSASYGHYISYCKNINNQFFYINDSNVKISNFDEMLKDNSPYILFYKKQKDQLSNYIKY